MSVSGEDMYISINHLIILPCIDRSLVGLHKILVRAEMHPFPSYIRISDMVRIPFKYIHLVLELAQRKKSRKEKKGIQPVYQHAPPYPFHS